MGPKIRWIFVGFLLLYLSPYLVVSSLVKSPTDSSQNELFDSMSPVVFVPGHAGNQMEMLVEDTVRENSDVTCKGKTGRWMRSWLNVWQMVLGYYKCLIHRMSLEFVADSGRYSNQPGVRIRIPGWGQTRTTEYIDPSFTAYMLGNVGSYAAPLINTMKTWGYQKGVSVRSAPYDFRYGANYQPDNYYDRLRLLIENTYETNNQKKVTLLAHSMGGLLLHHFLVNSNQEWKDKYVHAMVTLSTPWKGAVLMLIASLSGYTWGSKVIDPLIVRELQRSAPSSTFLFPSTSAWGANDTIIITAERNYTAFELNQALVDAGFPDGVAMRRHERSLANQSHPGVDTYCLYSSGIPTPAVLVYAEGEYPDGQPSIIAGDGDGTANLRSLQACRQWGAFNGRYKTEVYHLPLIKHNGILKSRAALRIIKGILATNVAE